jgi:hypothetical protein
MPASTLSLALSGEERTPPPSGSRPVSRARSGRPREVAASERLDDLVPVFVRVVHVDVWMETALRRNWTVRSVDLASFLHRIAALTVSVNSQPKRSSTSSARPTSSPCLHRPELPSTSFRLDLGRPRLGRGATSMSTSRLRRSSGRQSRCHRLLLQRTSRPRRLSSAALGRRRPPTTLPSDRQHRSSTYAARRMLQRPTRSCTSPATARLWRREDCRRMSLRPPCSRSA